MPSSDTQSSQDERNGSPFTPEDIAAADAWHSEMRLRGVTTEIDGNCDELYEVLLIRPPFAGLYSPSTEGTATDVRWTITRRGAIVLEDHFQLGAGPEIYATMAEALQALREAMLAAEAAFIADMPETLLPSIGGLLGSL